MKCFVTGASGFIGANLVQELVARGHGVRALVRERSYLRGLTGAECEHVRGDVHDRAKMDAALRGCDWCFHVAASYHLWLRDYAPMYAANVEGTRNVLKAAKAKHFVFLSTAKVYFAEGKPITEDSPLLPLKEYEKSKLAAENVCTDILDSKDLLIFRAVNIVGKGQPEKAVIPVLFQKAAAGEPLEIFGPKDSVLQLLYVEYVVDGDVDGDGAYGGGEEDAEDEDFTARGEGEDPEVSGEVEYPVGDGAVAEVGAPQELADGGEHHQPQPGQPR